MAQYKYKDKWRYRAMVKLLDGTKQRISGSCTIPNSKAQARILEHNHIERLTNPNYKPVNDEGIIPSFEDFAEIYINDIKAGENKASTVKRKMINLRVTLVPFFGNKKVSSITTADVLDFIAGMKTDKKNTKNNYLILLKSVLRQAQKRGLIAHMPEIIRYRAESRKVEFLPPHTLQQIIEAGGRDQLLMLTAVNTGMRIGELIGLRWQDVDFVNKQINVNQTYSDGIFTTPKSNKSRPIPMNAVLLKALSGAVKAGMYVFSYNGEHLNPDMVRYPLEKALKQVGYKHITYHIFRHTFASYLVMDGVSLHSVKELMGHADIKETMKYAHLAPHALSRAVAVLEARQTRLVETFRAEHTPEPENAGKGVANPEIEPVFYAATPSNNWLN